MERFTAKEHYELLAIVKNRKYEIDFLNKKIERLKEEIDEDKELIEKMFDDKKDIYNDTEMFLYHYIEVCEEKNIEIPKYISDYYELYDEKVNVVQCYNDGDNIFDRYISI